MAEPYDLPAWILLFLGLYAFAAGLGEFRAPGGWRKMLAEWEESRALQFLTGVVILALGGLVYLASPWRPDDWLSILVAVIGGLMTLEGILILAFGRPFMAMARALMGLASRGWAIVSMIGGMAFVLIALLRL